MADAVDYFQEILVRVELDEAQAVVAAFDDRSLQTFGELDLLADAQLAAGPHQCFPALRFGANLLDEQDLDQPADLLSGGGRVDSGASPEQARRQHARVVEHEPVACPEKARQVAKAAILPTAWDAVDDQHAAVIALLQGLLRNQIRRQVKVEIGNPHTSL